MGDFISALSNFINRQPLIFGAILGWLVARIGEELRKPNLKIIVGHEAYSPTDSQPTFKFLHVKVLYPKRNLVSRLLLGNIAANNARAWVSFNDYVTGAEIFKMNGRWTSKREPVNYLTNKVDLGEALVVPREVIPAGEETNISIAIKENGKREFHGFNNESYLHNWKKPDFELDEKRYRGQVKISSEGNDWEGDFLLLNPSTSIKSFRLIK